MSFCHKFLVSVVCFLAVCTGHAQERNLGTWKSFMPYSSAVAVCDGGDKVFCGCSKSIFSFEKSTGTIQTYDKTSGLNDIGIKTLAYDAATHALIVAYNNSNLDIIFNETDVYNIPDIKNKSTTGAITINGISFYNGNAYVATDFGISIINLSRKEITNTYVIGATGGQVKVFATATNGTTIYAATDEGVKHAAYNSANLQDFNSWTLYGPADSLPQKKASFVAELNGRVYAVISDTLFAYNGIKWSRIYFEDSLSIKSLNTGNGSIYFTAYNGANFDARLGKVDGSGVLTVNTAQFQARPLNWFEDGGTYWVADFWNGASKVTGGSAEIIAPDGPRTSSVFSIEAKNGEVKVAPGGVDDSWGYTWNYDGFFTYINDKWNAFNGSNVSAIANYSDILSVVSVEATGKTYAGSFLSGLIVRDNQYGSITTYDKTNSLLEGAIGDAARTKISCMRADDYGNLWIGNAGATKPIKLIKPDGTWKEFSVPYSFDLMKKILIDKNNQLWAPLRGSANTGVLVFSYNGTIDDPSDDVARVLRSGDGLGGLPDPVVYCLAEDKEGNIWAGTNQGIGVFYCPGSVLTSNGCDADQIKVERDGYIGYLFGTEQIRAIAVDAANRKWIGTSNGLWLISADGKTELLKFTKDNSPLPDNQITDIAIDSKTGEVFIGTIGGLVSYQGDAMSECNDCDGALVYPNPVKPDYNGPIAIKGLVEDAYVKITDVTGTLVYQGKANGSQMIWDGKGYKGERAKSGVYLVFSSTDLGKEKRVAKILIAN